jgi:3-methyladenine DNA glycosylase AlkD
MDIEKQLLQLKNLNIKKIMETFFKHKPNYILGIRLPVLRKLSKQYENISLKDLNYLFNSHYHECRIVALIVLIDLYEKAHDEKYINFYLKNLNQINNWDLVDISASRILGVYLYNSDSKTMKRILLGLSSSKNIWSRRIAVISLFYFIKHDRLNVPINIFKHLVTDPEYYVQTAVGWMLREVGKKNRPVLIKFLTRYYKMMPKVMLSYAMEKLDPELRKKFRKK